jgi:hypothetical protein
MESDVRRIYTFVQWYFSFVLIYSYFLRKTDLKVYILHLSPASCHLLLPGSKCYSHDPVIKHLQSMLNLRFSLRVQWRLFFMTYMACNLIIRYKYCNPEDGGRILFRNVSNKRVISQTIVIFTISLFSFRNLKDQVPYPWNQWKLWVCTGIF